MSDRVENLQDGLTAWLPVDQLIYLKSAVWSRISWPYQLIDQGSVDQSVHLQRVNIDSILEAPVQIYSLVYLTTNLCDLTNISLSSFLLKWPSIIAKLVKYNTFGPVYFIHFNLLWKTVFKNESEYINNN